MEVKVNSIVGIDDAICSMFMSRWSLTNNKEYHIRKLVEDCTYRDGNLAYAYNEEYNDLVSKLAKFGKVHITLLKFIDISVSVRGLHRAGQDDWDAHAKRFDNRIIRVSSRIANIKDKSGLENLSDYYKDKVLTLDSVLEKLDVDIPDTIEVDGKTYVKTYNGYVEEQYKDNQDVLRGLYTLGFPSNFIFKCNLTEFAHVYKERGKHGGANPEVKELAESIVDQLQSMQPWITRELLMDIKN